MNEQPIQLVFASIDADYVHRVVQFVRDSPLAARWQLTAFTNSAALRHYLRSSFPADMVALDGTMRAELAAAGEWPAIPTAALCDGPGEAVPPEVKAVKRLQPLPQLFHALYAIYSEQSMPRRRVEPSEGANVAAICSAAGGAGKTTLAIHLAHQAAISGCRTFYLNLETWNGTDVWLGGQGEPDGGMDGFAQLLYTLQSDLEQAVSRLPSFSRTDVVLRFDYFEPCRNPEDRISLSTTDARQIIDTIARSGLYELIVVDLDGVADELHMAVFERCSQLIYVEEGSPSSERKTDRFMAYARNKWGEPFRIAEQRMLMVRRAGRPVEGVQQSSAQAISSKGRGVHAHAAAIELPFIETWRLREGGRLLPSSRLRGAAERVLGAVGIGVKEHAL
ncbi:AAA domain-containing protein [Paenibacillus cellulosilyticus]|uniref:AAA domain-containing protein n=1 Tax=Paenibacillus cellulosilyticus TaxID=375489 RepID=A0A2V2YT17_9BACL|nr:AAA family ATPase [Paenibacillus cellulosilyticus]PWW02523.1 AAA domain-containing protein [Paenibacillus cellulosilyticus]QKS47220.1 AAA family ATPase [Paenibacillus cellulosilyticus]